MKVKSKEVTEFFKKAESLAVAINSGSQIDYDKALKSADVRGMSRSTLRAFDYLVLKIGCAKHNDTRKNS